MSHYFENDPQMKSKQRLVSYQFAEKHFSLLSDIGVFAKNELDYGTFVLMKTVRFDTTTQTLLDLGCGYGPLGLTLATLHPQVQVDLVDINERAVQLTQENIARLALTNARSWVSDGFQAVPQSYSMILFNPPIRAGKKVIYRLMSEAKSHLLPGGTLWIVIRRDQGAESAYRHLMSVPFTVELRHRERGYYIYVAQ